MRGKMIFNTKDKLGTDIIVDNISSSLYVRISTVEGVFIGEFSVFYASPIQLDTLTKNIGSKNPVSIDTTNVYFSPLIKFFFDIEEYTSPTNKFLLCVLTSKLNPSIKCEWAYKQVKNTEYVKTSIDSVAIRKLRLEANTLNDTNKNIVFETSNGLKVPKIDQKKAVITLPETNIKITADECLLTYVIQSGNEASIFYAYHTDYKGANSESMFNKNYTHYTFIQDSSSIRMKKKTLPLQPWMENIINKHFMVSNPIYGNVQDHDPLYEGENLYVSKLKDFWVKLNGMWIVVPPTAICKELVGQAVMNEYSIYEMTK